MPSVCSERLHCSMNGNHECHACDRPRLVLMGPAGVGKTAIIQRFLYDSFPDEHRPTVEEMHRGKYEVGGDNLTIDILDTSGFYEFPAMRRLAISTAKVIILVYSIDRKSTYEAVSSLRDLIYEVRGEKSIPIIVVGNKCDLEDKREVQKEIAETVVSLDWENGFLEVSAKSGENIVELFKLVLSRAHIHYALETAIEKRRKSLPVQPTCPKNKHSLELKRHSCTIQ